MSSHPPHSHRTPNKAPSSSSSGSAGKTSSSGSGSLSTVDARFKHLTEHVFPDAPYHLTVPSDRPFHLGNRFVSNWAVGRDTVFAPEEDHLQYMTFLSHQDEDTLLVAVGGWADEKGNIMPEEEPAKPTPTPQSGGGQKKKISLSDYKKKARETPVSKSESGTPSIKDEAVPQNKEAADQSKSQSRNAEKPKKRDSSPAKQNGIPQPAVDSHQKKSNGSAEHRDAKDKTATPPKRKVSDQIDAPSPKKRPRLSTDIPPESDRSEENAKKAAKNVPRLLSPTLPSTASTTTTNIPKLLSPTLPADLEEELVKYPNEPSSSTDRLPSNKKTQSSRPSLASTTQTGQATGRTHSGSTSSSGSKSPRPKTKAPEPATVSRPKDREPNPSTSTQPPSRPDSANPPASSVPTPNRPSSSLSQAKAPPPSGAPSKRRLVVKLKYGRQNRKRVEALLKFCGKKKIQSEQLTTKQKGGSGVMSSSSQKETPETAPKSTKPREPSSGLKRPKAHDADDPREPASKRPRSSTATSSSDRPRTPTIQVTKPSPTTASPKNPFATPNKDLKGVAMRRVGSADSDNKSQTGISPQSSGPGSAEKATKSSSRSSEGRAPGSHESDRRAWRDEFHRFAALGRSLKHASLRYRGDETGDNKGSADDKLAAVTAVESILCFILAFVADDKFQTLNRQPPDSTNWRSIIAYWNVVTKGAAQYPHLHGLSLFLGAISQEAIHSHDLERLAVSALPSEHSPAPTPGSDGNTVTSEESKKYKREFAELKSRLPESYRDANRLWLTGSRELSDDVLVRQYPNTWSSRSRNFSSRGTEKLKVGKYAGEYFLPLGRAAMPLEAVRFGLAFLEEWCQKEGVSWKAKLTL